MTSTSSEVTLEWEEAGSGDRWEQDGRVPGAWRKRTGPQGFRAASTPLETDPSVSSAPGTSPGSASWPFASQKPLRACGVRTQGQSRIPEKVSPSTAVPDNPEPVQSPGIW